MSKKAPTKGVSDYVDIFNNAQGTRAFTGTAAQTSAFGTTGVYDLWADQDVYIKIATTADDVTTGTGYLLRANTTVPFLVRKTHKIGAIRSASNGTLYYHKIG